VPELASVPAQELPRYWELLKDAAFLRDSAFTCVRDDDRLTAFALAVAAGSMALFAIGGYLMLVIDIANGDDLWQWEALWKSVLVGTTIGIGLWMAWVAISRVLLANLGHSVNYQQLMRVQALACVPLAAGVLMFIPYIGFGIALLAVGAWIIASAGATQSAFNVPQRAASISSLAGFAVWSLVLPVVTTTDNPLGPGIFWFDWSKDVWATLVDSFLGSDFGA
jgi:hypothetical protein